MNEALRKYIVSLNCTVVNPILAKLGSSEVVGFYCKSTSILRKPEHLKLIKNFIAENKIDYHLFENESDRTEFSIYKN